MRIFMTSSEFFDHSIDHFVCIKIASTRLASFILFVLNFHFDTRKQNLFLNPSLKGRARSLCCVMFHYTLKIYRYRLGPKYYGHVSLIQRPAVVLFNPLMPKRDFGTTI